MGIGFLRKCDASVPHGLSLDFLKNGGEVITMKLTELLGSFWEVKKAPKDWCQLVIEPIHSKDG